jgi:hypothetical protein
MRKTLLFSGADCFAGTPGQPRWLVSGQALGDRYL